MRVLYIDLYNPEGHRNFTINQLNNLSKIDSVNLDIILRKKDFCINSDFDKFKITYLDVTICKNLNRYSFGEHFEIINLIYRLKIKEKLRIYDRIIFGTYHEVPFFFLKKSKKIFLINHNNISNYLKSKNILKNVLCRHIFKKFSMLVLDTESLIFLQRITNHDSVYSLTFKGRKIADCIGKDLKKGTLFRDIDRSIFLCTTRYADENYLAEILTTPFNQFLEANDLYLILKSSSNTQKFKELNRLKFIEGWLSKEEYDYLFMNSRLLVLNYNANYIYRISSILLDCLENDLPFIINDSYPSRSMKIHKSCVYENYSEFLIRIKSTSHKSKKRILLEKDSIFKKHNILKILGDPNLI